MSTENVQAVARELVTLHESAREIPAFSVRFAGFTPAEGYAAAAALHAHRLALGWRPLGRKIGFTNRTIWPRYGVYEPMWGWVYDRTVTEARNGRARVPLAGLAQPRIEPEIVFKLKAPPRGTDTEALLASIEWVAHSIEIVQCHHPAWKIALADCTADNALHGRLVLGTPIPVASLPRLADLLPRVEVVLSRQGIAVDRGVGANVLDSPLNALAFLVRALGAPPSSPELDEFWAPLQAGEVISTGVLTDAHPVCPGERWHTSLAGLPLAGLEIEFT